MKFKKAISLLSITALIFGVSNFGLAISFADEGAGSAIIDDEEIVTPGNGNPSSDNTEDGNNSENASNTNNEAGPGNNNPTVVEEEEVYNPGPSTNRQTNEEIEKVPSTREATATKQEEPKEFANINQAMNASAAKTQKEAEINEETTKEEERVESNNQSAQNSTESAQRNQTVQTPTQPTTSNMSSLAALNGRTSGTEKIGETSVAPKTADERNVIPLLALIVSILGITEVFLLKKRID